MVTMNINEAAKSVYNYLEEIEQVLLEMESEVNTLFSCDPEDIDVGVERISQYREIIDEIFTDIRSVTDEDETGGLKLAVSPLTNTRFSCTRRISRSSRRASMR